MKMAQQQAPPAAQAPIVVVVDEVQITSDAALVLAPGAQHVKDHTPCLSWTTVYDNAGAVTNYTLGQSDAKGAFLPRCRFSVDQQTGAPSSMGTTFSKCAFQWGILVAASDRSGRGELLRHPHGEDRRAAPAARRPGDGQPRCLDDHAPRHLFLTAQDKGGLRALPARRPRRRRGTQLRNP